MSTLIDRLLIWALGVPYEKPVPDRWLDAHRCPPGEDEPARWWSE